MSTISRIVLSLILVSVSGARFRSDNTLDAGAGSEQRATENDQKAVESILDPILPIAVAEDPVAKSSVNFPVMALRLQ